MLIVFLGYRLLELQDSYPWTNCNAFESTKKNCPRGTYLLILYIRMFQACVRLRVFLSEVPFSYESVVKILLKGLCTNHVDRILGNFDPPPPYVDTFTK